MAENSKTVSIKIKCLHCGNWFDSGIWMTDRNTFSSATLFGNLQECDHCGKLTACNKSNFKALFEDGGFIGEDT